jgi:integrase
MAREASSISQLTKTRLYIKAVLEYALDEDLILKNPARGNKLTLPTKGVPTPSGRFYSLDEVHFLFSKAAGKEHLVLRLFIICGFRPGELFALRVDDVEGNMVMVDEALKQAEKKGPKKLGDPKTRSSINTVTLSEGLREELKMWIEAHGLEGKDFLFPSEVGTPTSPTNYLRRTLRALLTKPGAKFNRKTGNYACKDLYFDLTYQAMRRTCATYFREDLKDAQRQLRHSTPMTTAKHYQKSIDKDHLAAVEKLDQELCPKDPKTCVREVQERIDGEEKPTLVN